MLFFALEEYLSLQQNFDFLPISVTVHGFYQKIIFASASQVCAFNILFLMAICVETTALVRDQEA